jgi:hypothetical protein
MRIGPNRRTPAELKDQLYQAHRAYREGKEKLVEQSVTTIESKTSSLFAALLFGLILLIWTASVLSPAGFERLYEAAGLYPIGVVFVISYFTFYIGSKLVLKPSADELSDDTSYFALFSACGRKEMRSLISIGASLLHTLIYVAYLVNRDTNWLALP